MADFPESFVCEVTGDHKEVSVGLILFHMNGAYLYSHCVLGFWEYGEPGTLPTKLRAFFPFHLAEDRIFQNGDIVNIFGGYGKRGNISAEFQRGLIARVFEFQPYDPMFGIGRDILQTNAAWRDPRAFRNDQSLAHSVNFTPSEYGGSASGYERAKKQQQNPPIVPITIGLGGLFLSFACVYALFTRNYGPRGLVFCFGFALGFILFIVGGHGVLSWLFPVPVP